MASQDSTNYGFDRAEMYSSSLANTVSPYDRHVFLCYKNPNSWPPSLDNSDDHPLPKIFASVLKSRKDDIPLKTRLTICSGCSGDECCDGDVYIFPEMIKYRGLKEEDVDSFVDDVIVNGKPWSFRVPETLVGAYVFVCAHTSRDKRCGVCGPILIEKFKEEIESRGLNDQIFVSACSHVGGHKYAGNLIIFGTDSEGKVTGDWYGYVTPDDVPNLLDVHIGKGEIIEKLWRGQMGKKDDTSEKEESKPTAETTEVNTLEKSKEIDSDTKESTTSCCQGVNGVSCCRDGSVANGEVGDINPKKNEEKGSSKKGMTCIPSWAGKWEQSDILMGVAIVGAVATIAVAYTIFRRST